MLNKLSVYVGKFACLWDFFFFFCQGTTLLAVYSSNTSDPPNSQLHLHLLKVM